MSASYADLVKGRTLACKLIKRLDAKCQSAEAEVWNEAVLEMQKSALERHWTSFQTKQLSIAEIASISDTARDRNEVVAIKIANMYHGTKQRLAALMTVANPNHNRPLPKISEMKLGKFDGDYTKWVSWRALFSSKVLETGLPTGTKIDLFQSALEGEARKCAGEAEHRDAHDLDRIWKKLGETYEIPYQIVTAHVNQLIDIPTMEFGQADKLRSIIDTVEQECRSLNRFNCETDSWGPFLAVYILRKLDKSTRAAWEMDRNPTAPPALTELLPFLERRIFAMRNLRANSNGIPGATVHRGSADPRGKRHITERGDDNNKRPRFSNESTGSQQVANPFSGSKGGDACSNCKGSHRTWNCEKLASMDYGERVKRIKELKICEACLSAQHPTNSCTWRGCKACDYAKHNRMNCPKYPVMRVNYTNRAMGRSSGKGRIQPRTRGAPRCHTITSEVDQATYDDTVLYEEGLPVIGTAICRLRQDNGTLTGNIRILCDSGSQVNLITQECVQRWNLGRKPCKISVAGIGDTTPIRSYGYIDCILCHRDNQEVSETVRFVVVKRISGRNPQTAFRCHLKNQLNQNELADPTFTEPGDIEGLIGISTWATLIRDGIVRSGVGDDHFLARDSMLGWVISGHAGTASLLRHLAFHATDVGNVIDMDQPIGEYFITRVIWGFTSSGFNAVRALQQCAVDEAERFPVASVATLQNFYVDDFLGGADSVEELRTLYEQMTGMLGAGGFPLAKWATNNVKFAGTLIDAEPREIELQANSGVLGMIWDPKTDNLYIRIHEYTTDSTKSLTKRQIISYIAQIYDPTGLYAPVIVVGKIIIQEIWKLNLAWDDVVPATIMELWSSFQQRHWFSSHPCTQMDIIL